MLSKKTDNIPDTQIKNLLSESALWLAILTATLYCIGTSHFYGFLIALNTDPYLIDRSFHQIIYYGAFTLMNAIAPSVIYALTVLMTLYVAIVIGLLEYDWTYRQKKRLVRLRKGFRRIPIPKSNMLKYSISICLTFFVIIGTLYYFQAVGSQASLSFIKDIKTKNTQNLKKITVWLDSSEIELFRVACGASRCLGVDESKMRVRVFEKNAVLYTKIISER